MDKTLKEAENLEKPSILTEIHRLSGDMINNVSHTAISDNMMRYWDSKTREEQITIALFFQLFLDGEWFEKIIERYREL